MASIGELVMEAAARAGVDPRLALEVAIQESGLNPAAVSPKGALGVMQLMPATAAQLRVDPRNLVQNIEGGVRYLKEQLATFRGDVRAALAAYNWGALPTAQARARWGAGWLEHAPAETRNYVGAILGRLRSAYRVTIEPAAVAQEAGRRVGEQMKALTPEQWKRIGIALGIGLGLYALGRLLKNPVD